MAANLLDTTEITRELIRIDTTNYGNGNSVGETEAAEYVEAALARLGIQSQLFDSAPGRTSLVGRVEGEDPTKPALVLHGHLDVVPAIAEDWSVDPFAAELRDGMVWGRGAVDMKNMDAMILSSLAEILQSGRRPARDLIIAFFADEESGGVYGSQYLAREKPELFAGATEAISEVGGYSITLGGKRAYLVQTGEKTMVWVKLIARGQAGHGSLINNDNAVTTLAKAIARIGSQEWPLELTSTTESLLTRVAEILELNADELGYEGLAERTGPAARFVGASLRTVANPTGLTAGYKHNVIPDRAEALLDIRTLPGQEDRVLAEIADLAGPGIEIEVVHRDIGLETPFRGPLVDQMAQSIERFDPGAEILPYLLSAGTDNKALSKLGITGYGFAPLRLPADMDFPSMFHGVDERVPVDALVFGKDVLTDLLLRY